MICLKFVTIIDGNGRHKNCWKCLSVSVQKLPLLTRPKHVVMSPRVTRTVVGCLAALLAVMVPPPSIRPFDLNIS